jgi:hypothetical protein
MSNPTHPFGDRQLDMQEPQFTFGEAAQLAGVDEKTVRNWLARDTLDVGSKNAGRWEFSYMDVLQLKVAASLSTSLFLEPSVVGKIAKEAANMVSHRAMQASERNPETGKLIELETGFQHWKAILVAFENGAAKFWCAGSDPSRHDPPRHTDIDEAALRRPYIVIPADALAHDLFLDIERLWIAKSAADSSPFETGERAFLDSIGGISQDTEGKDVLVGLSYAETIEYLGLVRSMKVGDSPRFEAEQQRERYLKLHNIYELARISRIAIR